MAKGYHSRSPEEFQEYLESIKRKPRSAFWKQFIIFVDIIIIMVIFYLVYQFINPGSMNLSQKSIVEDFQGLRLSLSASQISANDGAVLYLVLDNKTKQLKTIPGENWKFQYTWMTENHDNCGGGEFTFSQKPQAIPPESTALLEIPLPPPSQAVKIEGCKKEHFTERKLFGLGSFKKRILILETNLLQKSSENKSVDEAKFSISLNPYKSD
ncbi:MAG: hypothetical protein JJT78_13880 [Leptospira sp.]|nr:hypothetical protein [Leptospira sp.]